MRQRTSPPPEQSKEAGWNTSTSGLLIEPSPQHRVPHPEQSEGWESAKDSSDRNAINRLTGKVTTPLVTASIALLVIFGARASDTANGQRYDKLSHHIMCPCGCNELLGECNHVGCPDSDKMRSQLAASIDKGEDDTTIFRAFQDQYGATALAAPMFTRFNQFSWWVPPVVLVLGIGTVFAVVRRWRPQVAAMPVPATNPHISALEDRVRRETGGDL